MQLNKAHSNILLRRIIIAIKLCDCLQMAANYFSRSFQPRVVLGEAKLM